MSVAACRSRRSLRSPPLNTLVRRAISIKCLAMPRHDEERQRSKLHDDRERNQCGQGFVVKEPSHDAADQPSDAIAGIVEAERDVAFPFTEDTGDYGFKLRVLRRIAKAPQQHP